MSHPIIYALGGTENARFPLILTIGREPNYDDKLINVVGQMDIDEFRSMSGGVWVTAYTQIAKQYYGPTGTSSKLKALCFEKNASPIIFSNAFPMSIPNEIPGKAELRKNIIAQIPGHIETLFSNPLVARTRLVIQHGIDTTEPSLLAQHCIKKKCLEIGVPYVSSPFFHNKNSASIKLALSPYEGEISKVIEAFCE